VLWTGIRSEVLQLVASDNCPFLFKDLKLAGRVNFAKIPNGLPGVEDRYTLLYDGGVRAGEISLNRFVELVATAPAKLFGLYPRKGTIAPGSDADIVVFEADTERVLSASSHHLNVVYSCYEGRSVRGVPELVMQRGNILVDHGKFLGQPGQGEFLTRSRSGTSAM
jgi:dihydropyrimidinase